ncbi:hypothetical protein EOA32_00805 [Mesorhizobium sp. M1A.F.Ca.ET.072.01.1.1]|uniref:hypothetical protein n=1 Tax=Mesorhizobium sp. M1A.F.Ca.ET.072.01.1.1 TaxID=2496753 RepID=UPI000FD48B62|nr:hypothetical protein [Mesorhizobium sp. M1A.F.Ca.ET.072.01.1.1]RUW55591.1 hypothetical protein EOA32_00805 [Mesorhizobium sp. M1A.F.Ca.ET.072.01.1.1]
MLPDWVKPGASFLASHGGEPTRFHVRAVVDDNQVVMRYWRPAKQRWQYIIECDIWFEFLKRLD